MVDKHEGLMTTAAGYGEIDAVKAVMEELVKRRDEGAEKEIKSMLVYGNPGIGKTTLIECLLRLGEAPQVSHNGDQGRWVILAWSC